MTDIQDISKSDKELAIVLIKAMIGSNPIDRPPSSAVENHPFFWSPAEVLNFFQVYRSFTFQNLFGLSLYLKIFRM